MNTKFISYYTIGRLGTQEICFPEDRVCCKNCERAYEDSLKRPKCKVLDRLIFDMNDRWDDCPINFTGEIRGTRKETAHDGN